MFERKRAEVGRSGDGALSFSRCSLHPFASYTMQIDRLKKKKKKNHTGKIEINYENNAWPNKRGIDQDNNNNKHTQTDDKNKRKLNMNFEEPKMNSPKLTLKETNIKMKNGMDERKKSVCFL